MKTSKQIDKEKVTVAATVDVDTYFKMKFAAERAGYKDMSNYIADKFRNLFLQEELSAKQL